MKKWEKQAAAILKAADEAEYPMVSEDVELDYDVKALVRFIDIAHKMLHEIDVPKRTKPNLGKFDFWA